MNEYAKGEANCNKEYRKKYDYPTFFDGEQPLSERSGGRSKRTMQDVFLYAQKPFDRSWHGPLIFEENFY